MLESTEITRLAAGVFGLGLGVLAASQTPRVAARLGFGEVGISLLRINAIGAVLVTLVVSIAYARVDALETNMKESMRRLALQDLADRIDADSDITQVYLGCEKCTDIGPLLDALTLSQKHNREVHLDTGPDSDAAFSVLWVVGPSSDASEIIAAMENVASESAGWLQCRRAHSDIAARLPLRGSVYVHAGSDGWVSEVRVDDRFYVPTFSPNAQRVEARIRELREMATDANSDPCMPPKP